MAGGNDPTGQVVEWAEGLGRPSGMIVAGACRKPDGAAARALPRFAGGLRSAHRVGCALAWQRQPVS